MTVDPPKRAPADSRLGKLQRGRGDGWLAAVADGKESLDDVLACVRHDSRVDSQLELRERYYATLLHRLDASIAPLVGEWRDVDGDPALVHGVIAGLWVLGHAEAVALLAAGDGSPLFGGVVRVLHDCAWAKAVDLPAAAAREWLRVAAEWQDSAQASRRARPATPLGHLTVHELLELARGGKDEPSDRLLGELCARGDEATRAELARTVAEDVVFGRVRLAARALGTMGDERVLDLAETLFAREDVFEDPKRRLSGFDRMRRMCLSDYVVFLPPARARVLARRYMEWGGYFETVAGKVFAEHATAADRAMLEARIAERRRAGDDWGTIFELDALGRLGDARSAPLLLEVARDAEYSLARVRAINALSAMPDAPGVAEELHQALWDCEDEAAATACTFAPRHPGKLARLRELAIDPLVGDELRRRAERAIRSEA